MATQQSIDHLVGLAVAMLGVAPGTDWLNARAKQLDGGATLADIANEIQSSSAFEDKYPAFLTNERFAKDFLEALLGGHVDDAVMTAAVDFVAGQLAGASRGELALALVDALTIIGGEGGSEADMAFRALHSGNFGKAAEAFHNKVMVAKYYTEEKRMEDPSASVLEGITDDPATVETAKRDIDSPPADAVFAEPGAFGIDENASGAVGMVEATDANGDEVTYRLVNAPNGFAIDAATGAITYTGEGLDHETTPTVELTVHASSTGANGEPTEVPLKVTVNVGDVDDVPEKIGLTFSLTTTFDEFPGADMNNSGDDTIFAQPVQQVSQVHQDTLNPEDDIDGGDGNDSIYIWKFETDETLLLGAENIRNVENAILNTVGAIDADLTGWDGLESVLIDRVGREADHSVRVLVDDGATVSTSSKVKSIAGDVTIVGAKGEVSLVVGEESTVHIGSDSQTETVMVEGGDKVTVDNGSPGSEKQSETVTSVSVKGTLRAEAEETEEVATYRVSRDLDGIVVGADGTTRVEITVTDAGGTVVTGRDGVQIKLNTAGRVVLASDGSTEVTDREGHKLEFNNQGVLVKADGGADKGKAPVGVTNNVSAGRDEATFVETGADSPTIEVLSNAIERIALHESDAIVLVRNDSKDEEGKKGTPEDLAITVDGYGGLPGDADGKICLTGAGTSENVMIEVAGDSAFRLATDKVKTVSVSGEGDLELSVTKFNNDKEDKPVASTSLQSIKLAGAGDVAIGLTGMSGLTMVDAAENTGAVSLTMTSGADPLGKLEMVNTGAGNDTVTLNTDKDSPLESIDTGAGNDRVTIRGSHPKDGIEVSLGDGDDRFTAPDNAGGNVDSRIDAGDGVDTLHLTSIANSTYREDGKQKSIYTGFETLNVGGSEGGVYDVKLLGIVNHVLVSDDADGVTLANMADGMGIVVSGRPGYFLGRTPIAANQTEAEIVHQLADRETGQPRSSGELEVSLTANGFRNHTGQIGRAQDAALGEAVLTLTTGEEIEVVKVTSNANPSTHPDFAGSAATRMLASDYVNEITLELATGATAVLEEIIVDGNAQLKVMGSTTDLAALELLDATANSGGVTFSAVGLNQVELLGGSGNDDLMAGTGGTTVRTANEIYGGLGGDKLTGGTGRDHFIIEDAAESQASTDGSGDIILDGRFVGHDTIVGFEPDTDKIDLSRSLLAALKGNIKNSATDWDDWMRFDHNADTDTTDALVSVTGIDGDGTETDGTDRRVENLDAFIGNGDGLFESRDLAPPALQTDAGNNMVTNKYSIALVDQTDTVGTQVGLWLLFDVNGDGDFDADDDMVIFLEGASITAAAFNTANDSSAIFI